MVGNTRTQACNQGLTFGKQINSERSYFQEVRDSSYSDTRRWMQLSELLLEDTLNPSIISITSLFFYTSWSLMELSCVCFWRWNYGELWRLMSGIWGMGELQWRRHLWPWLWLFSGNKVCRKNLGGFGNKHNSFDWTCSWFGCLETSLAWVLQRRCNMLGSCLPQQFMMPIDWSSPYFLIICAALNVL